MPAAHTPQGQQQHQQDFYHTSPYQPTFADPLSPSSPPLSSSYSFTSSPSAFNTNTNMYSNNNNNHNNVNDGSQQGNINNYQSNTPNITRQPTQQQREQLLLQRQHQQLLQQQMQAEDSLRLNLQNDSHHRNQHRVARQDNNNNGATSGEPKPPGYFSYPPQPHHVDSSLTTTSSSPDSHDDGTFRSRLRRLYSFPCSVYGKGLIGVIGVEALLVIIMQVVIVVLYFGSLVDYSLPPPLDGPNAGISLPPYLDTRNQSRAIPAYLIVFVFAQLFQLVFAWDAVSVFLLRFCICWIIRCNGWMDVVVPSMRQYDTAQNVPNGYINTRRQSSIDTCSFFPPLSPSNCVSFSFSVYYLQLRLTRFEHKTPLS